MLASLLAAGSVSWLYYSDRLVELPLGVFGVAIGTIILPALSKRHAEQSTEHFSAMLDWGLRVVLLLGVPAALALAVLAEPFLITLFHYGAMTDNDIQMAAMSLRAYAFGLVAFMLIKVLAPGFFARQDTKNASQGRHYRHGCEHGLQPGADLAAGPRGLGAGDGALGVFECRAAGVLALSPAGVGVPAGLGGGLAYS